MSARDICLYNGRLVSSGWIVSCFFYCNYSVLFLFFFFFFSPSFSLPVSLSPPPPPLPSWNGPETTLMPFCSKRRFNTRDKVHSWLLNQTIIVKYHANKRGKKKTWGKYMVNNLSSSYCLCKAASLALALQGLLSRSTSVRV